MNNTLFLRPAAIILLTFCLLTGLATAQTCPGGSGCLDQTFGDSGLSTVQTFGAASGEGTMQSDGKAIVLMEYSGSVEVIRFDVHGGLDLTFGGGDGIANLSWTAPGGRYGVPHAVATQQDDGLEKLIVAGWTYVQEGRKLVIGLRVDRLMPDGSLDTSFGAGGSFIRKAGYARGLAIQPWDQKIVTVGAEPANVTRLMPDGGFDTSFGSGGIVNATNSVTGYAAVFQPDGKIVVTGSLAAKGQKVNMGVARFHATGAIDTGFGTLGKTGIDFGTNSRARDVKLSGDKIVVVGSAGEFTTNDMAVARLTSSGQLDTTFSSDGKIAYDFEGLTDYAWDAAVRLDGRILVVADFDTLPLHQRRIAILGFTATGSFDPLFGTDGVVTTAVSGNSIYGRKLFFQNDDVCSCEKLLLLGMMNTPTGAHAVAARYLP